MPRIPDQIAEKLYLHKRQRHHFVANVEPQILKIDQLVPEAKIFFRSSVRRRTFGGGRGGLLRPFLAPQQTFDSRQQDRQVERLRQVIVGARFKSLQHVFGPASRRQHQYRNIILRLPQLPRHRKPIFSRQHHVQHQRIIEFIVFQQPVQRFLSPVGDLHGVALRLQVKPKPLRQVRLIFHDQNPAHTR